MPEGEDAGQDERLSAGHAGHLGGAFSAQQPAGIAAAGAGQIASTVRAAPIGSIPATSASATKRRANTAFPGLIERMVSKIRASQGFGAFPVRIGWGTGFSSSRFSTGDERTIDVDVVPNGVRRSMSVSRCATEATATFMMKESAPVPR